jgi:inorganic triphosphatase YgiF
MYTLEQAIRDGVLVDVSEWAKETGLSVPTAFTRALWARCRELADSEKALRSRAEAILRRCRAAARRLRGVNAIGFRAPLGREKLTFHAAVDTDGIMIGLPEDLCSVH